MTILQEPMHRAKAQTLRRALEGAAKAKSVHNCTQPQPTEIRLV